MQKADANVQTLSEVRAGLGETLRRFRAGDRSAIAFGRQGRAEAVLLPFGVFEEVAEVLTSESGSGDRLGVTT